MKSSKLLYAVILMLAVTGCASLKEISDEYPILTHIVLSNAVSQRIKHADNPEEKAGKYMAGASRLRAASSGTLDEIPYSTLGEFVRTAIKYDEMVPADRKGVDDLLLLVRLVLERELEKKGLPHIPMDYKVNLRIFLDAIESGARVYLPQ